MDEASKDFIRRSVDTIIASGDQDAIKFAMVFVCMLPREFRGRPGDLQAGFFRQAQRTKLIKAIIAAGDVEFVHRMSVDMFTNERKEPWVTVAKLVEEVLKDRI